MNRILVALIVTASALVASAADDVATVPADKAIRAPLPGFSAQGALGQVIEKIAKQAGAKILVDWIALNDAGVSADANVTVQAANATAGQLLDSALSQAAAKGRPLTWIADASAVRVSTQDQIMRRGKGLAGVMPAAPSERTAPGETASKGPAASMPAQVLRAGGEINFDNIPLNDALTTIRQMAGVNFHINWRALELSGINKDSPVSLQARNISPAQAMNLIFDTLNAGKSKMESVYWVVDGGVVLVSTGTALDTEMRTHTYDIADLLMSVPDFVGPIMTLNTTGNNATGNNSTNNNNNNPWNNTNNNNTNGTGTGTGNNTNTVGNQTAQSIRAQSVTSLTQAIQNTIGNDMWAPTGKGSISLIRDQLIITQSLLGWKLMEKGTR